MFTPNYHRKVIYGALRTEIGKILRELCKRKGVEIIEAHAMPDHIHMLVSIPPNERVSSFMGYLKGKSMNIEEDSIGDAIRLVGGKLKHFHTGENNRNIPGRGHLNWDEIFQALKEIGYKGRIVSEPFLMMGNEVGYDIRVWRPILENPTEERLDAAAKELLDFTRSKLKQFSSER